MLSMGQLKCGLEVKDATALNIYSINRFIRVEARLLLISLLAEMRLRWKPDLSQMLEPITVVAMGSLLL